jgi:hypothetical protein
VIFAAFTRVISFFECTVAMMSLHGDEVVLRVVLILAVFR